MTVLYLVLGTAITTGADTASVQETVIFPANSADGDTVCVDIAITDDDIIEADETFQVDVRTFAGLSTTTVTIIDDDSKLICIHCQMVGHNYCGASRSSHDNNAVVCMFTIINTESLASHISRANRLNVLSTV